MKFLPFLLICVGICIYISFTTPQATTLSVPQDVFDLEYGDPIEYYQIAAKIKQKTARQLAKQYHLSFSGFGGQGMVVTRTMDLAFDTSTSYTIDEARRLLINSAEIFIQNVNGNHAIRPYLVEYPFPISRIGITVYCNNKKQE